MVGTPGAEVMDWQQRNILRKVRGLHRDIEGDMMADLQRRFGTREPGPSLPLSAFSFQL